MEDKINILLIEDNPADSKLVSIFLKGVYMGSANLLTADSLDKGFKIMKEEMLDVIILDLSLPDSWGLDTFNKIHEKAPDIPTIVLTGIEDETIGIDAVKMGAQDFLIKGKIKGGDLQRAINYSIERHKLIQSLAEKTNALYLEKQKLAEAQKLAHIGSWEWDLVKEKITPSDEFCRIHGMAPNNNDVSPEVFMNCIHPDDREYVNSILTNIAKSANQITFTYRIIRHDGAQRTLYASGEVLKNEKGDIIKIVGTGQDATERVQEEEMEKLVIAATKSFNSVVITDEHGNIEWVNEGFTSLTGYKLDEVKGTHGETLRHGKETGISEDASFYKRVLVEKMPITYESKNFSKTGKEYWTITTLSPVVDKKGTVKRIIAIDSDITLRKQMEEDLLHANQIAEHSLKKGNQALNDLMKAKRELEESVRVKEQFLANMSHEIRTPMNAIVGFTDLIIKTQLSQEQSQYIDAIKTSGENLIVIINDILDFSKIQSGKISFEQIEFSVSQLVSTVTELMLPKSIEKNIKLSKAIGPKVPDRLIGDPTRINQILLNLVGNAIKFTEKGEVKIMAELASEDEITATVKFTVADTGIGISADKLPKIFDAFTQAANDTTRKYGGTGLGLAIVKQLTGLLGSEINVTSESGKGSSFTFDLVFKKNLKPQSVNKEASTAKESNTIKELNVLLVEDNNLNQILAKKVLSDWGWHVDIADNGLIAIEKLEHNNFDVVLMDIQLPEMDGYEATRHIRKDMTGSKSDIPIIAMTAHAISGEEEKCYKAGMNGYVSKPFQPQHLYEKIATVLNDKKPALSSTNNGKTVTMENGNNKKVTNLSYLENLSNGNNEFIIQMLTLFIEQTPDSTSKLEKYLEEKNWDLLSKAAHKMKPSVMFVGIKPLETDLKLIEQYANDVTNLDTIPEMVQRVKALCTQAIVELKEELANLKP